MLDISIHFAYLSRIRNAHGAFQWRKSNIRSENGQKEPVSCTNSNIAARDHERYWADYMAAENCGSGQCSVLDGLHGG